MAFYLATLIMNEGNLYQPQRITLVSNISKLFAGTYLDELAVGQIGILAQDGRSRYKGTTAPVKAKGRKFKIALGMPDNSPADGGLDRAQIMSLPHQTVEFSADQIVGWDAQGAKPFTKEPIVAIGYDGVDATKTISVAKGKKLTLHLHLYGGPIFKITNTKGFYHKEFTVEPDCLGDSEPGTNQACIKVQKALIDQMDRTNIAGVPLKRFVKYTGISSCDNTPAGLVNFTQYTVTLVDNGSDTALGLVQAQYPGLKVSRSSRVDLLSTYSFNQPAASAAPAAASVANGFPVLPNCATCPSGYTLQASGQVFETTVPSETVPADQSGQLSKVKLSGSPEESVYQYVMPASTVPATFIAAIKTAIPASETLSIGLQNSLCTPPAASTTAWAAGITLKRAPKVYKLTLFDSVCGTSRLAEVQAKYANTITEDVVGQCSRRYQQSIYSDPIADGCGEEQYVYTAPEAFEGFTWEPAPAAANLPGCSCGILLEGVRAVRPVTETTFPYIGYDKRDFDFVTIKGSVYSHDYTGFVCQTTVAPFTPLQDGDYPIGHGRDVVAAELESLSYFLKEYNQHPVIREVYGDKFQAHPAKYYDEYRLEIRSKFRDADQFDTYGKNTIYRFFFPVGLGKEFRDAINGLVASADLETIDLVTV